MALEGKGLNLKGDNTFKPVTPGVRVTDIVVRGGGGTVTFSDGVTVEYLFQFIQDPSIPSGGIFDVTLQGDRAKRTYENVISQAVCDMVDWVTQCSSLNRRVSELEKLLGRGVEFTFEIEDWDDLGVKNQIHIINEGTPGPGEIGPHELGTSRSFHISVWKRDGSPAIFGVDTEFEINLDTGLIKLIKAPLGKPFAGRVIVS